MKIVSFMLECTSVVKTNGTIRIWAIERDLGTYRIDEK